MMIPERPGLERRVLGALEGGPGGAPRIPVLLGGCGTGRTSLLLRLRDLLGPGAAQYVDVEGAATTPERFLAAMRDGSSFAAHHHGESGGGQASARAAFDAALAFLDTARTPGGAPATFLLDEFLELRTFESFPGLRAVLRDLVAVLGASGNRFVLATRYAARAHRLLRDAPAPFEIVPVAPLSPAEIRATLPAGPAARAAASDDEDDRARDELSRLVHAIGDGRPAYTRLLVEATAAMGPRGGADPVSALTSLLAPGGRIAAACRFSYELRLHRARGYGALKAILDVLAHEEPLTLTEIALRLHRTPGSTKDYLSWLEDVDLVVSRQKRYSFADPMLRLWVRLHARATPPADEDIAQEVHGYVLSRLPQAAPAPAAPAAPPALALAGPEPAAARDRPWGIIEID